jgi:hypothetical protein
VPITADLIQIHSGGYGKLESVQLGTNDLSDLLDAVSMSHKYHKNNCIAGCLCVPNGFSVTGLNGSRKYIGKLLSSENTVNGYQRLTE